MTDARLREAERRWRETGVVDDEAAWLVERLRVGLNRRLHLEWLTFLGHPAAERALAGPAPPVLPVSQRIDGQESGLDPRDRAALRETTMWAYSLLEDDRAAALRVLIASADEARRRLAPHDALLRRAMAALARRVWLGTDEEPPRGFGGVFPVTFAHMFLRDANPRRFYDALAFSAPALGREGAVEVARDALRAWWLEGRDVARELSTIDG